MRRFKRFRGTPKVLWAKRRSKKYPYGYAKLMLHKNKRGKWRFIYQK